MMPSFRAILKFVLYPDGAEKRGILISLLLLSLCGCTPKAPQGGLVLTQTPANDTNSTASRLVGDVLNLSYPPGSRVVIAPQGAKPGEVHVLSKGLFSAGAPVVCPSGDCVYFAGKASEKSSWQIYSAKTSGGLPKQITSMTGGAMDPAIISTGELVFSSPVPQTGELWSVTNPPALYLQAPDGKPRRISYGPTPALAPTVLRDGRILFVSARSATPGQTPDIGLFTINNDGTEVTAFAVDRDGAPFIRHPRELLDGRVGFLSTTSTLPKANFYAESVRTSHPFKSRQPLLPLAMNNCSSIEPDRTGSLLLCLETRGSMGRSMQSNFAVFRVAPDGKDLGQPFFDDPAWNEIEALALTSYPNPIGHVTAIMPGKKYGTILCMNTAFTRNETKAESKPAKIRIFTYEKNQPKEIGEVPIQSDGSFMAQVPAEIPLGFQLMDAKGATLQKSDPFLWLHPGENRSCIGCHEPYNRTIPNVRPIAAGLPPVIPQKGGS
jgi:hypothetical protein